LNERVIVDTIEKTIKVLERMSVNSLYNFTQDLFDEPGYLQHAIPMTAQTPLHYTMINGWQFLDEYSASHLYGGGIIVSSREDRGNFDKAWVGIKTVGQKLSPEPLSYRIDGGEWQDFKFGDDPVEECILYSQGAQKIEISNGIDYSTSEYSADLGINNGCILFALGLFPVSTYWRDRTDCF
jgi:hypothetical protein